MRPFLILLLVLALAPCSPATETAAPAAPAVPFATEQEWVINTICRNAYEMLSFIADKKGEILSPSQVTVKKIDGDAVAYEVTVHGSKTTVDATLHWPGSIWSSQAYVPFCQAVMIQLHLKPPPAGSDSQGTPLTTLAEFSEKSIQAENLRVSQWLTQEPDNAFAHQQAALVLGTLAMKENSGWFWDPRDICNHTIAHLAVARALNPGAELSIEGQLAECCVGLIADTKKECADELDHLDKVAAPPKDLDAWVRAGRMRNSRDWRLVDAPESGTGLEQVEYFRAYSEAVDIDPAIAWLKAKSIPMRPDWVRIVLEFPFSVEAGHVFALPAIATEIATMRATFPDRFQKDTLVADLNQPPGDVLLALPSGEHALSVISGGMWASFFQRHLCLAVLETGDFLESKWGVPDEAAQFDQTVIQNFSGLSLYPFLQEANAVVRKMSIDDTAVINAFAQHPEWAGDLIYRLPANRDTDIAAFHLAVRAWFTPPLLSGTAMDAPTRLGDVGAELKTERAAVDKLYAIAPLQYGIAELELTNRYPSHPTFDQVHEVMGNLIDYYVPAMQWQAKASDIKPEQGIALQEKMAALDPGAFWDLAQNLIREHRDDEAAVAYQQFYDKSTDRVSVSNSMDWLVNYYFDHNQKDKALAIAQDGAEVYSSRGLATMMKLQARMGQLDQAEDYGQKIKERYNDSFPLIDFYHQQVTAGNSSYQAKLDDSVLGTFPYGLKSVTMASFSVAPTSGTQFKQTTPLMEQFNLSSNQVIVALDGYKVENMAQYSLVRSFSDAPQMDFIVWDLNGQAYREIKATVPERHFGMGMSDYSH